MSMACIDLDVFRCNHRLRIYEEQKNIIKGETVISLGANLIKLSLAASITTAWFCHSQSLPPESNTLQTRLEPTRVTPTNIRLGGMDVSEIDKPTSVVVIFTGTESFCRICPWSYSFPLHISFAFFPPRFLFLIKISHTQANLLKPLPLFGDALAE